MIKERQFIFTLSKKIEKIMRSIVLDVSAKEIDLFVPNFGTL